MNINILDIISKYVKLERLGPGYTGRCPFCGADGVTGFIVSIQNQKYRCGKCGATGGIFQFLLSLKGIALEEALSEVRETFNIPFDSYVLDSRWNDYLQSTDYQKVMTGGGEKVQILPSVGEPGKKVAAEREPVSYTKLATFIRCPLEYKLRYRDKTGIYEPVGTRINVGRFLHSVATQFLKEPIDQRNKEFIESKFQDAMAEKRNPEYIDELRSYQDPTTTLLLEYFADKPMSKKSPHFRTSFGPFAIIGTADCLVNSNAGIQIIEFKEYDYREFEEGVEVMHYLQLLFYFLGLGGRGTDISGGAYCFFRSGYEDEVVFTDGMIDKGKEFIQAKLQEMTECQNCAPKLNALCISCGYKDKCKLQKETRGRRT